MNIVDKIHQKALNLAKDFKRLEANLISVLIEVETKRVFEALGYTSLFHYCTNALGLSESNAYSMISVARKSIEVPALKKAVETGVIHLSNARRIVPVLTKANQAVWIEKAASLSQRDLEKAIVKEQPKEATRERLKPVQENRSELRVGVSAKLEAELRRIQDLVSQKTNRAASLEEALQAMAELYLEKNDPLEKAKRAKLVARPVTQKPGRQPLAAKVRHEVNVRDQAQCTYVDAKGKRCTSRRWLQFHHRKAVANGGLNAAENLEILCFHHHRFRHGRANVRK